MSLTNPNTPVSQQDLQDFYHKILPYMGGSSGGGGGHTIEDAEGTDLTQRDTMQFGTGFNATDDSENKKTVVEADVMQSGDMDDIVTPLPSIAPKKEGIKYSTTEQVIGEWIDGKPLYQRTIVGEITNKNSGTTPVLFYEFGTDVIIQNINGRLDTNVFSLLIPYAQDNLTSRMAIFFNTANTSGIKNGSICYFSGLPNSLTSVSLLLNVQYTKTTDTPNT